MGVSKLTHGDQITQFTIYHRRKLFLFFQCEVMGAMYFLESNRFRASVETIPFLVQFIDGTPGLTGSSLELFACGRKKLSSA